MSFLTRLRTMLAGPSRVGDGGDDEEAAVLHEEFGTPDSAQADVEYMAETGGGGGGLPGARYGASEAGDTAEGELASEEAPSDHE